MFTIPTDADLAKLFAAAEEYRRLSCLSFELWNKEKMRHPELSSHEQANIAYKLPAYLAPLEKIASEALQAEWEAVNEKFPGLLLCTPHAHVSGNFNSGDAVARYREVVKESIADKVAYEWSQLPAVEAEIVALRKLFGPELEVGQFKPGDFAYSPYGVVKVTRVWKRKAKGICVHSGEPRDLTTRQKRISARTKCRLVKLLKSKQTYVAERLAAQGDQGSGR